MNKPILIATSLSEDTSIQLIDLLGYKYPALSFSRMKSKGSHLWKIHYTSLPGLTTNETEVKRYCMKLIKG